MPFVENGKLSGDQKMLFWTTKKEKVGCFIAVWNDVSELRWTCLSLGPGLRGLAS